uniref:Uncharacterized protein n=1 Tax=uncultured marine microorganism HF4000_010I05 TaxID=455517 RepID=B3T1L8_9ZZZZ|nr:hypothetical protein ALOHA_HF4000010I05ctg1g41 [uncultured marine microorganism HF4000_010I05]
MESIIPGTTNVSGITPGHSLENVTPSVFLPRGIATKCQTTGPDSDLWPGVSYNILARPRRGPI